MDVFFVQGSRGFVKVDRWGTFATCPVRHGTLQTCSTKPDSTKVNCTMSTSSPGRRLRDAFKRQPIAIPGVFNALVAKIAERLGHEAVYLSGGALSAAYG